MAKNIEKVFDAGNRITRRDFLNSMLLGTGAALCTAPAPLLARSAVAAYPTLLPKPDLGPEWYGYGGVGDYSKSHGNTPEVVFRAHSLRDGVYDWNALEVVDTGEVYDLVIVGCGLTGLGAALQFHKTRRPDETMLLLDNHPVFGGEAKRNEFVVDGYRIWGPQGSNGFSVPKGHGGFAQEGAEYFTELGIPLEFNYPELPKDVSALKFGRDDYGFLYALEDRISVGYFFDERSHGVQPTWIKDPWSDGLKGFPIAEDLKSQFLRWRTWSERPYQGKDFMQWLDTMTYRDVVVDVLGLDPRVAAYADPILASGNGGCSSVLSAFSAFMVGMPGLTPFHENFDYGDRHTFPGGNDGFSRCFVKAVMPDAIEGGPSFADTINGHIRFDRLDRKGGPYRMRLGSSVIRVEHEGTDRGADFVQLMYVKDRRLFKLKARAVVMATGSWITKYVVNDLPGPHREAMQEFVHTSVLVANVAIRHWRFVRDLGCTAFRWWDDLGFACILKQPMHVGDYRPPFDPDKPAVLSFYIPLYYPDKSAREQGVLGRNELLGTSFAEYEMKLRRLLDRLFGRHGFDARRDIAGIILNRWGHAYTCPPPGFFFGKDGKPPVSDVIRQRHGRIAFAHAELRGGQFWRGAAGEGRRAVDQLREVL